MMAEPNFNQAAEERTVLDGIAETFNDRKSFPDFEVIPYAGANGWRIHRMILSKRSEFFRRLFSEELTGNRHEQVINMGVQKDEVHGLGEALQYCYTQSIDYDKSPARDAGTSRALFYVHVFAAGERYYIKGLPELAADRFVEAINSDDITDSDLGEAIREVYNKTSSQLLRAPILQKVLDNAQNFLGGESLYFNDLLATCQHFNQDIIRALASYHTRIVPKHAIYECPSGGCRHELVHKFAVVEENGDLTFRCPRTYAMWTKSPQAWRRFLIEGDGKAPRESKVVGSQSGTTPATIVPASEDPGQVLDGRSIPIWEEPGYTDGW